LIEVKAFVSGFVYVVANLKTKGATVRILAISLSFLFCFGFVSTALAAESTINCHCFTERTYDHQKPEKVVPYLLATTQNSFLSVAFNAPKFKLVKDLMGGVPSDQLWISHYFSARFEIDSKSLMLVRKVKGSWRDTLKEEKISEDRLAPSLVTALQAADDRQLASAVVDEALLYLMGVDAARLKGLRTAGADNREAILSFFLAKRTDQQAIEIYDSVASGTTNWGTLAFTNNVQIGEMEQEFKNLLK